MSQEYGIDNKESFHIRKPALDAILGNKGWSLTSSGDALVLNLPLENYSDHERDVIEFARSPYDAKIAFRGISQPAAKELAEAMHKLFGPGGFYAK